MSKSEVERRESIARQLAEDNARLSSRVRRLEQDLHVLQQVRRYVRACVCVYVLAFSGRSMYRCTCVYGHVLYVCVQVEEDCRSLGSQVGVNVDSLSTETARAAIASAVNDALKDRESALQKVCSVFLWTCVVLVLAWSL